jgi:RimJ/RimL family protein N-acetyltransferase
MRAVATYPGTPLGTCIVGVDNPSFGRDIDRFLDELRNEPRYFGPTASTNPKPFPSLIEALRGRGGFRVAAVECGRIIGMARINGAGELFLAVVADRRGSGIGQALGRAALERAADLHYRKVVFRSTRRSRAARRVAEQLGCVVVDHQHGRTDLILTPSQVTNLQRSA